MPIGGGILPASGTNQYNELTYVTRRAFIPKLVVQIYNSTPLMAALIANSQTASGGVSSVSVPVQGSQFVNAQWSDYSGSFAQPSVQQGAYQAEFNLKLLVSPVPFLGMEGAVQQDYAIIPLIEARMNDATNVMMDSMATALYNNTSNNQQFIGLPAAVDDGTGTATYGNINRSTNTWWKSKQYAAGSVNPTRQNVLQYISGTVKNGAEVPTFGVCGFGTWTLLAQDYVGQENYMITPGSMELGGLSPRVHLLNSHNHSSRFKLILGIFRLVCSNGLMVSQGRIQALSFAHTQSARDVADVLTTEFFADAKENLERAKAWSAIDLTRDQQHALALTARNIRFGEDSTVDPASLLEARRAADVGDSLWLTFNRLQENVTQGGVRFPGMRRRSRNLTNIGKEVEVNTRLWTAAGDMAKDWGLPG